MVAGDNELLRSLVINLEEVTVFDNIKVGTEGTVELKSHGEDVPVGKGGGLPPVPETLPQTFKKKRIDNEAYLPVVVNNTLPDIVDNNPIINVGNNRAEAENRLAKEIENQNKQAEREAKLAKYHAEEAQREEADRQKREQQRIQEKLTKGSKSTYDQYKQNQTNNVRISQAEQIDKLQNEIKNTSPIRPISVNSTPVNSVPINSNAVNPINVKNTAPISQPVKPITVKNTPINTTSASQTAPVSEKPKINFSKHTQTVVNIGKKAIAVERGTREARQNIKKQIKSGVSTGIKTLNDTVAPPIYRDKHGNTYQKQTVLSRMSQNQLSSLRSMQTRNMQAKASINAVGNRGPIITRNTPTMTRTKQGTQTTAKYSYKKDTSLLQRIGISQIGGKYYWITNGKASAQVTPAQWKIISERIKTDPTYTQRQQQFKQGNLQGYNYGTKQTRRL
jgi:hypothetical protein